MQSDETENADGQIYEKDKRETVALARLGGDPGKNKKTHIVDQEDNRQTVGHNLPQEPAEWGSTSQQNSAEAGGQGHVDQKHWDQAEEAEDERISRETQGRHVYREVSLHEQ